MITEPGWLGVDLFFVLSGYLITGILVGTRDCPHYYRNFIARRAIRIFPLYYACLVLFPLGVYFADRQAWSALLDWGIGWFWVYLGNIRLTLMGKYPGGSLGPLWSLQVEEQFYLMYPLMVYYVSRKRLRYCLAACILVSIIIRSALVLFAPQNVLARYTLMPCRMDALALGGAVALLKRDQPALSHWWIRLSLIVCASFSIAFYYSQTNVGITAYTPAMSSVGYSINALTFASLLTAVVYRCWTTLNNFLSWRPLAFTGERAYGLYLLHSPSAFIVKRLLLNESSFVFGILALGVAYVAASLSWQFFEKPFLQLKDRFPYHVLAGDEQTVGNRT